MMEQQSGSSRDGEKDANSATEATNMTNNIVVTDAITAPSAVAAGGGQGDVDLTDENAKKRAEQLRKRVHAEKEIVETEKRYLRGLNLIFDVFMVPIEEKEILNKDQFSLQFGQWETIRNVHTCISEAIEYLNSSQEQNSTRKEDGLIPKPNPNTNPKSIGEIFFKYSHALKSYTPYLVNFDSALSARGALLTNNRKFANFVDLSRENPNMMGADLESLLIAPVQRIPRYRLLLETLLKYTPDDGEYAKEHEQIKAALGAVCEVATANNEAIRASENRAKVMEIMYLFEPGSRVDLAADASRKFIMDADLQRQCRREVKPFRFWLFNDQLLYGDPSPIGYYKMHRALRLAESTLKACPTNMDNHELGFCVESPSKSFIAWAKDEEEYKRWYKALEEAISEASKMIGRDKSQSSTAPVWVPDTQSNQCQICDSALGMLNFKPRHHCRNCGRLVCGNCSRTKCLIVHIDKDNPVRVCDTCKDVLITKRESESASLSPSEKDKLTSSSSTTSTSSSSNFSIFSSLFGSDKAKSSPGKDEGGGRDDNFGMAGDGRVKSLVISQPAQNNIGYSSSSDDEEGGYFQSNPATRISRSGSNASAADRSSKRLSRKAPKVKKQFSMTVVKGKYGMGLELAHNDELGTYVLDLKSFPDEPNPSQLCNPAVEKLDVVININGKGCGGVPLMQVIEWIKETSVIDLVVERFVAAETSSSLPCLELHSPPSTPVPPSALNGGGGGGGGGGAVANDIDNPIHTSGNTSTTSTIETSSATDNDDSITTSNPPPKPSRRGPAMSSKETAAVAINTTDDNINNSISPH